MQSYIKLFFSFREETSALTDAEIGRLVRQMLAYGEFGDTDGAMSGNERFLFPVYRAQIARDSDRYAAIVETRAECGRAGARAKAAKRDSGICRKPEAKTGKTTKKEEKEKKIKKEDEEKKIKAEDKEASAAATEGDNADGGNTEALEMYACDNLSSPKVCRRMLSVSPLILRAPTACPNGRMFARYCPHGWRGAYSPSKPPKPTVTRAAKPAETDLSPARRKTPRSSMPSAPTAIRTTLTCSLI